MNNYIPNNTSIFSLTTVFGQIGFSSLNGDYLESIADNVNSFSGNPTYSGSANYYSDPDGVVRPAAGAYQSSDTNFDGRPMLTNSLATPSRPVMLNRPFNSVGELGYTYRDVPWKDLDFFTTLSGDAALLDAFSLEDTSAQTASGGAPLVAGKVNLNSQNRAVLSALLAGTTKDVIAGSSLTTTEAANIATTLIQ